MSQKKHVHKMLGEMLGEMLDRLTGALVVGDLRVKFLIISFL